MDHQSNNESARKEQTLNWLKEKMSEKFGRDFNLDDELTMHTENEKVKVALTPESATVSQQELLSLSFYVDQINNDEVEI